MQLKRLKEKLCGKSSKLKDGRGGGMVKLMLCQLKRFKWIFSR